MTISKFITRHSSAILIFLSFAISIIAGAYINIFTGKLDSNQDSIFQTIKSLGNYNLLLTIIPFIILAQIYTSTKSSRNIVEIKISLIKQILEAACKSLIYPKNNLHIRAIVTIANYKTKTRMTTYSYNVLHDPERTANYPLDFGITGEAFTKRYAIAKELPHDHIDSYADNVKESVLVDLKSILAVPIFAPTNQNGPLIGVLAFDSAEDMKKIKFDSRTSLDIAQRWADIIADLIFT